MSSFFTENANKIAREVNGKTLALKKIAINKLLETSLPKIKETAVKTAEVNIQSGVNNIADEFVKDKKGLKEKLNNYAKEMIDEERVKISSEKKR